MEVKTITYIPCIFLKENISERESSPLPDVDYQTINSGLAYIEKYIQHGIRDFLVFGSTDNKSIDFACERGIVKNFIRAAKTAYGDRITLYADVGLSPYTKDGHSVISTDGAIDYAKSYAAARQLCVAFAEAGCDYVAPCLSLPEQVRVLREVLDAKGFSKTKIMSYSAKFSSSLYGGYRAAVQSPLSGEVKKSYQTDYTDSASALQQISDDEKQGADIVMVKPAMFYLDVVYQARQLTKLPLAVYHVSGEYAMIKTFAKTGMVDEEEAFDEAHAAFQRCGVEYVIGYAPNHFLRWQKGR